MRPSHQPEDSQHSNHSNVRNFLLRPALGRRRSAIRWIGLVLGAVALVSVITTGFAWARPDIAQRVFRGSVSLFGKRIFATHSGQRNSPLAPLDLAGDYRSAATGNWNAIATWETFNGTSWIAAVATPTSADGVITIRSPHTVTISAAGLTYDQVVVDSGAQVTVAATITHTLANGTGTDLTINGIWLNSGGTWTTTGTWAVGPGGTYVHNTTSGVATPLGAATLDAASNFVYRGSSTLTPALSTSNRTYGNLTFESTAGSYSETPNGAGTLTVNGNFTIGSGVTLTITQTGTMTFAGNFTNNGTLTNSTGTQIYTFTGINKSISGSGAISFETFNVNAGASLTATVPVTEAATFIGTITGALATSAAFTNSGTMTANGTFQLNQGGSAAGTAFVYGAASTLIYAGNASSQTSTNVEFPAASGPFNVTINNSSGATLHAARTISGTLSLFDGIYTTAGLLSMANGSLIAKSAGDMTGTPQGAGTYSVTYSGFTKPSGSELAGAGLTNITVDMNASQILVLGQTVTVPGTLALTHGTVMTSANTLIVAAGGTVTRNIGFVFGNFQKTFTAAGAKTFEVGTIGAYSPVDVDATAGTFPANFTVSATATRLPQISGANALNRYWTLTSPGTITANLTFTYLPSDIPGGTIATYQFIKNSSGTLSTLAPAAPPTTTTATINGVSSFSDWTLAEPGAVVPGSLQFSAANFNDSETNADHPATISVTRTSGSDGAVDVTYNTSDGSATLADNDYLASSGSLHWTSGDAANKTFTVTVKGDATVEPDETVNLTLSLPTGGAALGSPNPATLTIQNDDNTVDYTVTTTGNAIVVTDVSGNSDTFAVTEPVNPQIKFAAPGRFFSVDGGVPINGDSGNLSLVGVNNITVNQGNGDDTLNMGAFTNTMPSITINGDQGDDTVNFNGTIVFANNRNLNVDLQDDSLTPGVDSVRINASLFLTAAGTATVKASMNVTLSAGGVLQVENGALTVEGNQQAIPIAGDFDGVDLIGGQIYTTGSGAVSIKGTGGAGDFVQNFGVLLDQGGKIKATTSGTLDVQGTGGAGSGGASAGSGNYGVEVSNAGSEIVTTNGSAQVTGLGGNTNDSNVIGVNADDQGNIETAGAGTLTLNGTGGTVNGGSPTFVNSGGVFIVVGNVDGGTVKSTGTGANAGAIIITGTANPGGNGAAQGVRVDGPASVTTVDGSITITGAGAICSNACLGTSIRGNVTATGAGAISLTGTGGVTNGAFPTHGVNVRGGGLVSTVNGDITISGTGGSGSTSNDNLGFALAPNGVGTVKTTGTGAITVNADSVRITTSPNATMDAGANAVSLRQRTNGTLINLGSPIDTTPNTLELSDPELDRITAGTLNLGNAASGAVTVSANITRPAATILALSSSANIDIAGGSLHSNGGNIALVPGTNVFPSLSGVDVTTGAAATLALTSAKALKIVINNTTVDTGYTQLNVAGLVNLNTANLSLSGTHVPVLGQTFVIVNNDGADAITGNFSGLPEGALINNFLGSPLRAQVSYVGGTGNDAVLTVVAPPTAAPGNVSGQILDSNGVPVEGAGVRMNGTQNRLTVTDANGNYHFDNVETSGFYTITPSRVNFSFSPAQRSFSQLGNNTEATFSAWTTGNALNPLDTTEYFVRQQYVDFLSREPDEEGLNFWYNNIESCRDDANCRTAKRIDTSAAFFLSIEFQQTGYLVYKTYQSAYGDMPGAPVPVRLGEFKPDSAEIGRGLIVNQPGWQTVLENNKQAYLAEFVQRSQFVSAYPTTLTPGQFVDKLFRNAGVIPADSDRAAAIDEFGLVNTSADVTARGRALRRVAENSGLARQESNQAFVLMQYFGYLRRDANGAPDADFSGYSFWLDKLNAFNGNFRDAEMVKAFLVSGEYRGRFPR